MKTVKLNCLHFLKNRIRPVARRQKILDDDGESRKLLVD